MKQTHSILAKATLLMLTAVSACTSHARDPVGNGPPPPAPAPTPAPAAADTVKVTAAALNPLRAGQWRIKYVEGKRKGEMFDVTVADAGGGHWKETTAGIRSMTMRLENGAIVMPREEDVQENVALTYDPPFVLLPAACAVGARHEGQTTMTVFDLKSGARRDSGRCRYVVELLGTRRVETPAGTFDTHHFRTVREIDLSLAKVTVTIETDHAVDVGIVRTRVEQNTRAIGIFTTRKLEESVRVK